MTPLAAQLFRHGGPAERKLLARAQFFEVSKIVDMAEEMGLADVAEGGSVYSEMAQLPADVTVMEFARSYGRMLLIAEQHANIIMFAAFVRGADDKPRLRFTSGFMLGTEDNAPFNWAVWEGEKGYREDGGYIGEAQDGSLQERTVRSFNLHLEKLLLIINQPGLVQQTPRPTDKRVTRLLRNMPPSEVDHSVWHECSIRPGHHGEPTGTGQGPRALHYVRKYFKPSLGRWIDGYWRGDASLGTVFKWYSVPASRAEILKAGS